MIRYIQRRDNNGVETVDEFPFKSKEERKEARRCLNEYRVSDPYANYYMSQKACKDWND